MKTYKNFYTVSPHDTVEDINNTDPTATSTKKHWDTFLFNSLTGKIDIAIDEYGVIHLSDWMTSTLEKAYTEYNNKLVSDNPEEYNLIK